MDLGDLQEPEFEEMKVPMNLTNLPLSGQFWTKSPISSARIFPRGCRFGNFFLTNGGAPKWIMFFDSESPPKEGDVPKFRLGVKEGGMISINGPIVMRFGFFIAASTSVLSLEQDGVGRDLHIFSQIYSAI